MAKSIAVIGVNYIPNMGIKRLIEKLQNTMREPDVRFLHCSSTSWDIYHKIIALNVDKIIIIDQFADEDNDDPTSLNFITINDRILIVGINPVFFKQKSLPSHLGSGLQQIIFRIKRLILEEIALDSLA